MIAIAGLILGALIGAYQARRRQGNALDMAQYAAGYGIALGILGVFASIALSQLG